MISFTKQKLIDGYILTSLFLIPSSFLGLVPFRVFYIEGFFDLKLLSWLLSLPLLLLYRDKLRAISKTFSGKILIFVVLFILARFALSLVQGITFKETFTVFRMGSNSPISCLAFLCFFYSVEKYRIERIFKWMFILFTTSLILYLLNYSGFGLFENIKEINEEVQGAITINRNLSGFPIYFTIFFIYSFCTSLQNRRPIYSFIFLFCLLVVFLSATRSLIFTCSIILVIIIFFYIISLKTRYIKRILLLILAFSFFFSFVLVVKYDVYQFLKIKFTSTFNVELKDDEGTYSYRKHLIETAIEDNIFTNSMFLGKGYTRMGISGSYKFVLGGDTYVAPVIFCEGIMGLVIRIAPIFYFLLFAFKNLRSPGISQIISTAIIAIILSSLVSYVQTTIFFHYVDFTLFFYIAQRYITLTRSSIY